MIEIKNLHKRYDKTDVLKGINFTVNDGDVVAILGPSGSGKTTILRCMNFLVKADKGSIVFDGKEHDLANVSHKEISEIRKKTGFVFQNYNLFLNKTVLENVMTGLVIARKVPQEEAKKKAIEALEKVGMADRLDHYPSQLSGGQQQRVSIARALVYEPEVIYFDEPTSALDPELIGEVLTTMKQLAESGMTMVVVTHELSFAKNISNKVLFLDKGEVIENTDSKSFFENPTNDRVKQFLKSISERV
ncbi:MAG: amino acid ABC transporter ATP-binding protein [Erysipelotrichaceae bacterium]|nr:amino acid ABC transporter ATP-binding protein [Erysipelotrichaceae bacterium]